MEQAVLQATTVRGSSATSPGDGRRATPCSRDPPPPPSVNHTVFSFCMQLKKVATPSTSSLGDAQADKGAKTESALAWREWLGLVHHGLAGGQPNAFASTYAAPKGPTLNVWRVSGRGLFHPALDATLIKLVT